MLWNPVYVIAITGKPWLILQFLAAVVFVVTAIRVRVPAPDAPAAATGRQAARRR